MLRPLTHFSDIFPEKTMLALRTDIVHVRNVGYCEKFLERMTGMTVAVMGDMPLICHRGAMTPAIVKAYRRAGLQPASNVSTYDDVDEFIALAREKFLTGYRMASVYPVLNDLDNPADLLVSTALYNQLNNKDSINDLVSESFLPPNQTFRPAEYNAVLDCFPGHAVFLKGCNDGASGAGSGVHYCSDREARAGALEALLSRPIPVSAVRVELALDIPRCWCVSVAIRDDGVTVLGGALQLFSVPGKQSGSLIDSRQPISEEIMVLSSAIAERGRQAGYRGIAGFDIGIDRAGRVYAFDLNFRLAASTVQVLLHDAATKRQSASVSRSVSLPFYGNMDAVLDVLAEEFESGRLVPIRMHDAGEGGEHIISGFVVGESVEHCDALCSKVRQLVPS